MKFSWKIFIYTYVIMVLSFGIGGFLIIETSFENNLSAREDGLTESNQYLTESYIAIQNVDKRLMTSLTEVYCSNVSREEENSRVFIGNYSQTTNYDEKVFREYLSEGKRMVRIIQKNGNPFLQVISMPYISDDSSANTSYESDRITSNNSSTTASHDSKGSDFKNSKGSDFGNSIGNDFNNPTGTISNNSTESDFDSSAEPICIENLENISDIFQSRDMNYRQFQIILLAVSGVSGFLLFVISKHLTNPLKRLSQTAKEIGSGSFDKRVRIKKANSSAELRSLTEDFNRMAGYIEDYIQELKEENRRREEFVNNFSHELKTPLTSVIGYADLLRSYDMDYEKRRQFAEYIYHEGTRMESLALHLLDLIVLKKQEFDLKPVNIEHFFCETEKSLIFVMEKYHAALHMECEPCVIFIEADLMKTLIYNLADNGCKAMTDNERQGKPADIYILGRMQENGYQIAVKDTGIGIEEQEIGRITEEFYMVDKSRARTMGGAGLGLSLCREIAKIHGSELRIESEVGKGTCISIVLSVEKM